VGREKERERRSLITTRGKRTSSVRVASTKGEKRNFKPSGCKRVWAPRKEEDQKVGKNGSPLDKKEEEENEIRTEIPGRIGPGWALTDTFSEALNRQRKKYWARLETRSSGSRGLATGATGDEMVPLESRFHSVLFSVGGD